MENQNCKNKQLDFVFDAPTHSQFLPNKDMSYYNPLECGINNTNDLDIWFLSYHEDHFSSTGVIRSKKNIEDIFSKQLNMNQRRVGEQYPKIRKRKQISSEQYQNQIKLQQLQSDELVKKQQSKPIIKKPNFNFKSPPSTEVIRQTVEKINMKSQQLKHNTNHDNKQTIKSNSIDKKVNKPKLNNQNGFLNEKNNNQMKKLVSSDKIVVNQHAFLNNKMIPETKEIELDDQEQITQSINKNIIAENIDLKVNNILTSPSQKIDMNLINDSIDQKQKFIDQTKQTQNQQQVQQNSVHQDGKNQLLNKSIQLQESNKRRNFSSNKKNYGDILYVSSTQAIQSSSKTIQNNGNLFNSNSNNRKSDQKENNIEKKNFLNQNQQDKLYSNNKSDQDNDKIRNDPISCILQEFEQKSHSKFLSTNGKINNRAAQMFETTQKKPLQSYQKKQQDIDQQEIQSHINIFEQNAQQNKSVNQSGNIISNQFFDSTKRKCSQDNKEQREVQEISPIEINKDLRQIIEIDIDQSNFIDSCKKQNTTLQNNINNFFDNKEINTQQKQFQENSLRKFSQNDEQTRIYSNKQNIQQVISNINNHTNQQFKDKQFVQNIDHNKQIVNTSNNKNSSSYEKNQNIYSRNKEKNLIGVQSNILKQQSQQIKRANSIDKQNITKNLFTQIQNVDNCQMINIDNNQTLNIDNNQLLNIESNQILNANNNNQILNVNNNQIQTANDNQILMNKQYIDQELQQKKREQCQQEQYKNMDEIKNNEMKDFSQDDKIKIYDTNSNKKVSEGNNNFQIQNRARQNRNKINQIQNTEVNDENQIKTQRHKSLNIPQTRQSLDSKSQLQNQHKRRSELSSLLLNNSIAEKQHTPNNIQQFEKNWEKQNGIKLYMLDYQKRKEIKQLFLDQSI